MNKQLFIMNNASNMLSKKYINGLILEINKLDISKHMKELMLVASTNLLSTTKTSTRGRRDRSTLRMWTVWPSRAAASWSGFIRWPRTSAMTVSRRRPKRLLWRPTSTAGSRAIRKTSRWRAMSCWRRKN